MQDVTAHSWDASKAALPAWSLPKDAVDRIALPDDWPEHVTREWALGRLDGQGRARLHPRLGRRGDASARRRARERGRRSRSARTTRSIADEDTEGDVSGTAPPAPASSAARPGVRASRACASSASSFTGSGAVLLGGLRYAVEQGFDVINMSLSTTKKPFATRPPRARRQRVLQAQRCSSPRRTTCRSRATRGASRP